MPKAIQYFMNKKRLPLLLVMLAGGIFLAFQTLGTGKADPPSKYQRVLQNLSVILSQGHFAPKPIDDAFSKKIFQKYFEELDPEKNILLQPDLDALKRYETRVDDEMKGAPVEFFVEGGKIFDKRAAEVGVLYKELLAQPFDFTTDETVISDSKKAKFATSAAERKDMWRKKTEIPCP